MHQIEPPQHDDDVDKYNHEAKHDHGHVGDDGGRGDVVEASGQVEVGVEAGREVGLVRQEGDQLGFEGESVFVNLKIVNDFYACSCTLKLSYNEVSIHNNLSNNL